MGDPTTPEDFFEGSALGLELFRAVAARVESIGPARVRTTKSQVAFRNRRGFAWVWRPAQYIRSDVPAVLSIALPRRIPSARFKQVVQPAARVWMHHLELRSPEEVDDEVGAWLSEAWAAAAAGPVTE